MVRGYESKKPLRLACSQLRDMVDSAVTKLYGRGRRGLVLTARRIMRLPRLTTVFISCCSNIGDLSPLAACITLRTLRCSHTAVSSLAPLAACKSLHTLHCYNTSINSLDQLAACTALDTLDCSNTAVSSLEPLARCTALKKVVCDSRLSTDFDFMKNAKITIVRGSTYQCIIDF